MPDIKLQHNWQVGTHLLPVSALIPGLEHQFTVSVSAFIQALKLLYINSSVQLIFHSSFSWLMIAFATTMTVSTTVAVTVSRHSVNLHFQVKKKVAKRRELSSQQLYTTAQVGFVTYD